MVTVQRAATLLAATLLLVLGPVLLGAGEPAAKTVVPKGGPPGTGAKGPPKEPPKKPEMPPSVQWRGEILTPTVLPAEPVILLMTWRNTSGKAVKYPDDQDLLLAVRKVDGAGAPRGLWVARTIHPDLMIPLRAGESASRKIPVVLGWAPADTRPPIEFVLAEPGKYRLSIQGAVDSDALDVTVVEPASPEDRAARALWTTDIAWCLIAGARNPARDLPAIDTICAKYPFSRYAAYSLWIRAAERAQRGDFGALAQSAGYSEAILERHPGFPLREDTLKALVGLYATIREPFLAQEAAKALAREFPRSPHLARLREQFSDVLGQTGALRDLPAAGTPVPRAVLKVSGMELVPDGVRQALERFLTAVAVGDFAAVEGMLAGDFMGDEGRRSGYAPALWQQRRGAQGGQLQVAVVKAEMVRTFERELSLPNGVPRTWYGPLCVVDGALAVRWEGGQAEPARSMQAPHARWAFYEYPKGTWKVVSETTPTRNLRAGALARVLFRDLPRGFGTWRIGDGARQRCPCEEIKTQLGLKDKLVDSRTTWTNHQIVMVGAGKDEANVKGRVRMLLKAGAGSPATERWVERDVTLHTALGADDRLLLKGMTVNLADPREESDPSLRPKPQS